jgi:Flp pilus assembly protein TadG
MKTIARRLGRDRGAVAVEFALILPVLLLILFGTIEFGRVWSQYQVFNGAAREGARCAAVKAAGYADCSVQDEINQASGVYDPATNASVTINGAAAPAGCTDATKGQDVRVAWVQPLSVDIPFWGDVTVSPTISATFRCE